jgi:hypothetical protein
LKIPTNFPSINKWLNEVDRQLISKDNRIYTTVTKKHREVHYLEYFLEKQELIENADSLIKNIIDSSKPERNKAAWNARIAELGAFYLLGNQYGLNVTAYEKQSNSDTKSSDFVVTMDNNEVRFEVKYRAAMAIQTEQQKIDAITEEVMNLYDNKYLIKLSETNNNLDRSKRPNMQKIWPSLNSNNLTDIKGTLKERIDTLENSQILQRQNRKHSSATVKLHVGDQDITMHFLITITGAPHRSDEYHYVSWPDDTEDIKCWIFGDEESKVSMVEKAIMQNADYLMCCAPFEKPFQKNILEFFSDYRVSIDDSHRAISTDKTFRDLCGIIFFSPYGPLNSDYMIFENSKKEQKIKKWKAR